MALGSVMAAEISSEVEISKLLQFWCTAGHSNSPGFSNSPAAFVVVARVTFHFQDPAVGWSIPQGPVGGGRAWWGLSAGCSFSDFICKVFGVSDVNPVSLLCWRSRNGRALLDVWIHVCGHLPSERAIRCDWEVSSLLRFVTQSWSRWGSVGSLVPCKNLASLCQPLGCNIAVLLCM